VSGFSRIRHHVRKGIVSLRGREEAIVGVAFYGSGASLMLASWSHAHMTMSEYRVAHAVDEATTDTLTADKRSTSRSEPEIEPIAATCTAVLFEVPTTSQRYWSSSISLATTMLYTPQRRLISRQPLDPKLDRFSNECNMSVPQQHRHRLCRSATEREARPSDYRRVATRYPKPPMRHYRRSILRSHQREPPDDSSKLRVLHPPREP